MCTNKYQTLRAQWEEVAKADAEVFLCFKFREIRRESKLIGWSGKLHIAYVSSPEFNGDLWVNPSPFALASLGFSADSGCWPEGTAMWSKLVLGGLQDKRPEQRDWNPHQLRKQMARKDHHRRE